MSSYGSGRRDTDDGSLVPLLESHELTQLEQQTVIASDGVAADATESEHSARRPPVARPSVSGAEESAVVLEMADRDGGGGQEEGPRLSATTSRETEVPSEAAALRAAEAQGALESLALFGQGDEEEEEEEEGEGAGAGKAWYARRRVQFTLALNIISFGAICAGVALQLIPTNYEYLFRWLYFGGTVVPLYCGLSLLMERMFEEIELHYFRDTLSYLATLESATVLLLLALLEMAWFFVVFELLFCAGRYAGQCDAVEYQLAVDAVERVLLCVLIFAGACWISSGVTKAASTHFYRTAHFKKMQEALEKEYYLQVLSAPKRKALRRRRDTHNSANPDPTDAEQRSQFHRRSSTSRADGAPPPPPSSAWSRSSSVASSRAASILPSASGNFFPFAAAAEVQPASNTDGVGASEEASAKHAGEVVAGQLTPAMSEFGSDNGEHLAGDLVPHVDGPPQDLSEEMFRALVSSGEDENKATAEELQDEDRLEKLRTAVVVKTYSKLMEHYRSSSSDTAATMMRNVKAFSAALFKNLSGSSSSRKSVILPDFELFFSNTSEGRASAERAFALFDINNDGRVNKAEVKEVVMNIFRDRANIAGSLIDTDSIVQSLEHGFSGLIHFLFVGLYLLVWNINVVAGFATFSATLVGLSFIFGNSIRTIFESLVFLFSRHPYDVGDWVIIQEHRYQVKTARLLFTMMVNGKGHPVYMSNSELNNQKIDNLSRSTCHIVNNEIEVDMGLAEGVKVEIKAKLDDHIRCNPNDFVGRSTVYIEKLERHGLKATLQIGFTINYPGDQFERLQNVGDGAYQVISDVVGRWKGKGLAHTATHTVRLAEGRVPEVLASAGVGDDADAHVVATSAPA